MPAKNYNSVKSNTSTSVPKIPPAVERGVKNAKDQGGRNGEDKMLKSLDNNILSPNPGLLRMRRARLANINATPDRWTPVPLSPGPGPAPTPTPATTKALELTTQAGAFLYTQDNDYIVTNQTE